MAKRQRVLEQARTQGVIRARDVRAIGVSAQYLAELARQGLLRRVSPGLYELPDAVAGVHRTLAEVALSAPAATVCLLSALAFHGLGTQLPAAVWIAMPPGKKPPTSVNASLEVVWMSGPPLREGIETHLVEGITVKIFSAAKTVADCWRFRNRVGVAVAIEATKSALRQGMAMDELYRYAKVDRVWNVMRPYLEAIQA